MNNSSPPLNREVTVLPICKSYRAHQQILSSISAFFSIVIALHFVDELVTVFEKQFPAQDSQIHEAPSKAIIFLGEIPAWSELFIASRAHLHYRLSLVI